MASKTQKQSYARAVLLGGLKKEAYLRHVNPAATHPSSAAWRLEHTKTMPTIFAEVKTELDKTKDLEDECESALKGALSLLERVLSAPDTLSPQEAIRSLAQATRLLELIKKLPGNQPDTKQTRNSEGLWGNDGAFGDTPDLPSGVIIP